MITHVLFDFFGTLVEYSASRTEQGYEQSFGLVQDAGSNLDYRDFLSLWAEVSDEFDATAQRSLREFSMTELGTAFLSRAVGPHSETLNRNFVRTYLTEWNKGVCYADGISEFIKRLAQRFSLSIISNTNDHDLLPAHLESMKISRFFSHVVTSIAYGIRKPSPKIFHHMLEQLQISPEQCIYVGDNYSADYRGAQLAGIQPLLIDPASQAPIPDSARLNSIFALEQRLSKAH